MSKKINYDLNLNNATRLALDYWYGKESSKECTRSGWVQGDIYDWCGDNNVELCWLLDCFYGSFCWTRRFVEENPNNKDKIFSDDEFKSVKELIKNIDWVEWDKFLLIIYMDMYDHKGVTGSKRNEKLVDFVDAIVYRCWFRIFAGRLFFRQNKEMYSPDFCKEEFERWKKDWRKTK